MTTQALIKKYDLSKAKRIPDELIDDVGESLSGILAGQHWNPAKPMDVKRFEDQVIFPLESRYYAIVNSGNFSANAKEAIWSVIFAKYVNELYKLCKKRTNKIYLDEIDWNDDRKNFDDMSSDKAKKLHAKNKKKDKKHY